MRIMIVDDEELLRKSFYKMLPWEEIGIEILMDAKNGEEALTKLRELHELEGLLPDVVITDIEMPSMDGIELTKKLREYYPWLSVIILSNHEDYHYVRLAMKSGASDYLLKTGLSPEGLKDYLLKLKEELALEHIRECDKEGMTDDEIVLNKGQHETLKQVIAYINEHYEEKEVTLSFLANKFFIQKNYLCTIFKQEMDLTLTDYIVNLRMKKAKKLMRTTTLSITEIAERVSYTDLSYFNRLFRKENGMGPREYLNLTRQKLRHEKSTPV